MTGALKPPFAKSELKTENEPRKRGAHSLPCWKPLASAPLSVGAGSLVETCGKRGSPAPVSPRVLARPQHAKGRRQTISRPPLCRSNHTQHQHQLQRAAGHLDGMRRAHGVGLGGASCLLLREFTGSEPHELYCLPASCLAEPNRDATGHANI